MSDDAVPPKRAPHSGQWKPGQSGNPAGRPKTKPFKDALNEIIAQVGLREAAAALVAKANTGDVAAIKELGDRLDGRVPQGVVGGDDDDNPIKLETIRRIIVRPGHSDSGSVPPASDPEPV